MKTCRKINAITQARLINLMLDGVYTCQQLAEETGLHYITVLQYARELHRAGAAHIADWDEDARGRSTLKVYKIGRGKDAKRPRLTGAQRQERLRERRKTLQQIQVTAGTARYVQAANGRLRFEPINERTAP